MRRVSFIGLALCALAIAACDYRTTPRLGVLEPVGDTGTTNPSTARLTIIPNRVQLAIGSSFQLTTDAPFNLESRVQWRSLQPGIVAVTPGGVVTAIGAGTASVMARYSFDTTITALATVTVVGPNLGMTPSGTGGSQ
jgi:hypothetical protein